MKYIRFNAPMPPKHKIVKIVYDAYDDDTVTASFIHQDAHGQWWVINTAHLPDRFVCLKDDKAVLKFATRYGYMNARNKVHHATGTFGVVKDRRSVAPDKMAIAQSIRTWYRPGIPQRTANSGLCWYSAMCFATMFCEQMRDLIKAHSADKTLNRLIETCLHSPTDAEMLRRHLYYKYALGDDPEQSPEKDGQNGLSEFIILCAKLGIPVTRLVAPNLSELTNTVTDKRNNTLRVNKPDRMGQKCLLFVRCFRTRWKPMLRLRYEGRTYKLMSVLIGSEHCGHQIAASTCNSKVCSWACADADACRNGIGPIFWKVKKHKYEDWDTFFERWWNVWGKMVPVTLFNSNAFCDFSIHNRATCTLEHETKKTSTCATFNAGVVNPDFIYMCDGTL